jgi:hypothetical protein
MQSVLLCAVDTIIQCLLQMLRLQVLDHTSKSKLDSVRTIS